MARARVGDAPGVRVCCVNDATAGVHWPTRRWRINGLLPPAIFVYNSTTPPSPTGCLGTFHSLIRVDNTWHSLRSPPFPSRVLILYWFLHKRTRLIWICNERNVDQNNTKPFYEKCSKVSNLIKITKILTFKKNTLAPLVGFCSAYERTLFKKLDKVENVMRSCSALTVVNLDYSSYWD